MLDYINFNGHILLSRPISSPFLPLHSWGNIRIVYCGGEPIELAKSKQDVALCNYRSQGMMEEQTEAELASVFLGLNAYCLRLSSYPVFRLLSALSLGLHGRSVHAVGCPPSCVACVFGLPAHEIMHWHTAAQRRSIYEKKIIIIIKKTKAGMGNIGPHSSVLFFNWTKLQFQFYSYGENAARCVMRVECNCANIDKSIMTWKHYTICLFFKYLIKKHTLCIYTAIISRCNSVQMWLFSCCFCFLPSCVLLWSLFIRWTG